MQAYNQLLTQFHTEEVSTFEQYNCLKYVQLLNQIKKNKRQKQLVKGKFVFQSKRLKTANSQVFKISRLQKSLQASRLQLVSDTMQQKRTMVQLERQSLLKQIDNAKFGIQKIKGEKNLIQEQIKVIGNRQTEIRNAFFQSENNYQGIQIQIKDLQQTGHRQSIAQNKKIAELTQKLALINQQNVFNAKLIKQTAKENTQNHNNQLLGNILVWQKEELKIKKMAQKIYKKSQIQSMLRALFLIVKFSQLNYGNIIEHLIKISDQKQKQIESQKKIYLNKSGQQIQVKQLVQLLQSQILTTNECMFLSKTKIIQFYERKGIQISTGSQPSNLSQETKIIISKVISHYQKLTSWFSRIQRRNIQLSQYLRSLQRIDEQLQSQIQTIENSAAQKSINYLQSRQQQIQLLHQNLNASCKIIFQFNINVYDLVRRFQNLNKFFDKIVKSTHRRTHKRTFIQMENDTIFLKKINKILFKSPQCIILDWNNVIKDPTKLTSTGAFYHFEKIPDNQIYFQTIMKNDLLRIYAEPSMFDFNNSFIDNFQATFDYVINEESSIIQKLANILNDLLLFSKQGIKQFQELKIQFKQQRIRSAILKENSKSCKLNPFLQTFQVNDSKMNKFFSRDQIKQDVKNSQQPNFCVQSNDYYRRDNFKLIEKLQKINLKKKNLFSTLPFAVNTSLQLQPLQTTLTTVDGTSYERQNSRTGSTRNSYRKTQPRLSHQLLQNRHDVISERRERQSSRKKDLKNLLKNISSIATDNHKYRIRRKLNSQQKQFTSLTPKIH